MQNVVALRVIAWEQLYIGWCCALMARAAPSFRKRKKASGWAVTSRGTRQQRGYGKDWDRARERFRRAEPLCRACVGEGRAVAWTDLDHIVPKSEGGGDDDENLQPLCADHHKAKTLMDNARRRRAEGRGP